MGDPDARGRRLGIAAFAAAQAGVLFVFAATGFPHYYEHLGMTVRAAKLTVSALWGMSIAATAIGVLLTVLALLQRQRGGVAVTRPQPTARSSASVVATWVFLIALMLAVTFWVAVVAFGALNPELLAGRFGELFTLATWLAAPFAIVVLVVRIARPALRAYRAASGQDPFGPPSGTDRTSPPVVADARPAPSGALSASIGRGWLVAALASAVVFAALALATSLWSSPEITGVTTDGRGSIYAVHGGVLKRWDPTGTQDLAIDLRDRLSASNASVDLSVDASGNVYVAEPATGRLFGFDPAGAALFEADADVAMPTHAPGNERTGVDEWLTSIDAHSGRIVMFDASRIAVWNGGVLEPLREQRVLLWSSDFCVMPDSSLLLADTAGGRLVRLSDTGTTTIDCLTLPTEYRYPSTVEDGPDGTIYAVLRQPWHDKGVDSGLPPDGRWPLNAPPNVWMGQLYLLRPGADIPEHAPLTVNGTRINVMEVDVLPGDRLLVFPLNEQRLYTTSASAPGVLDAVATGDLGRTLAWSDLAFRVAWLGPMVFTGLAIVVPLTIGIAGALASRTQRP